MSRARKIGAEQAIEASMVMFWRQGFHNSGTRQLEAETGITRFSLQTSYGGKLSLFLSALDAYLDRFEIGMLPSLAGCSLETLATWFEARCDPSAFPAEGAYGCLMINSLIEFAGQEPLVNTRAERFYAMLRASFSEVLNGTKKSGALPPDFDVGAQVEVLISASIGLNVVIRSSSETEEARSMANGIAALVRGWANR